MNNNNRKKGGFAPLTLDLIGVNGLPGEEPLVDEINRSIQTIASHLQDDLADDSGTITVRLKLRRFGAGSGSISIESSVEAKLPRRRRAVASGVLTRNGLVTLEHTQVGLPLEVESVGGES